jgi:cyclophilin family peptidyl-prolyl cis-trans isomerase
VPPDSIQETAMRHNCFRLLVAVLAGCLVPIAFAQQAAPKPKAKTAPGTAPAATKPAPGTTAPATKAKPATTAPATDIPPDASQPGRLAYNKAFDEWKAVLKELRTLKVQFQSAPESDHPKLTEQWDTLMVKGEGLLDKLQAAGIQAYEESPNTDPQLGRFLVKLAADHIDHDRYADAKAITDPMIANECPDKTIYNTAAIAAYVLNDFEKAEEYFKIAQDSGTLTEYGRELEGTVADYKDLWVEEQKLREAEAAKNDLPRVKLKTTKGDIVIELFEDQAPDTVGNFVSLVEGKDGKGFYDGLSFHRVLKNFMAQGGDPKGDGTGGPGYNIFCECYKDDYRRHFAGTLSMAHAGRDTGGSQFFLTFRPTAHLNGKHTAFGRVVEGMDVLPKLTRRNPDDPAAPVADKILTATVVRKRDHAYAPKKVE